MDIGHNLAEQLLRLRGGISRRILCVSHVAVPGLGSQRGIVLFQLAGHFPQSVNRRARCENRSLKSVMRRFLLIAPALWVSTTVYATSFASFTGGPGDGYSSSSWRTYQPATLPAQRRFAGSGHDGYASSRMLSSWSQTNPAQARFAGNGCDGYTSSKMLSSWSQTKPRRFFGGSFDGYDRNTSYGIPNWTMGDTDGNGLPDWWELKYFSVLTGTPPQGD